MHFVYLSIFLHVGLSVRKYNDQCDQKKIAKCLSKLSKIDYTRKMIDFDKFTKIT